MTTTVKVHVNGNYRATCKTFRADGSVLGDPVVVGHGEEKTLPHYHGEKMTYEITEEQVKPEDEGRPVPDHASGP